MTMRKRVVCPHCEKELTIVSEIPALILSGGILTQPKYALEFRVWLHHHNGGDDAYMRYDTLKEAMQGRKKLLKNKTYTIVEEILAVVWDNRMNNFREVVMR